MELNERAFIKTMIVDKSEQGVELTLGFPLTNRLIPGMAVGSGQSQGKAYSYVSGSGEDLGQAFRNIQMNLSRRISFGQTRVIVLGRDMAEAGAEPVLEFVGRNAPIYLNTKLYVTTGTAKDLTSAAVVSERFPNDILTATSKFRTAIDTSIKDFMEANYYGGDKVVPLLRLKMRRIETEKEKEQPWIEKAGAAVFTQGKMVGTLNVQEMRGGLWILGQLTDAEITVTSPTDGKNVSFMIRNLHTNIKPKLGQGRTLIQIEADADASVISSDSNIHLYDPQMLKRVEKSLNGEVHQRITDAIQDQRDAIRCVSIWKLY
ncbi:hypothetical protein BK138_34310 [Paenibacillus rhizosphaerae]|uniref:Uncharacterized protein n=1 Tax=Paenibacillus rhizosphaerae TaxID=297318 RepID=A0A1R1DYP6_9BACL|nr:hypothetical protein BK138_34310 [Paenibacillus rhizosphaerae]